MRLRFTGRVGAIRSIRCCVCHLLIQGTVLVATASAAPNQEFEKLTEYAITTWTEDTSGSSPLRVYSIAQDRIGYLWLGTQNGLLRFDGQVFKPWDGAPLPSGRVNVIRETGDGSLWLGFATGGVARIRAGQAITFGKSDGLADGDVSALLEDNDGTIWVGSSDGLSAFRDGRWEIFGSERGLPKARINGLFVDSRGQLFVGSGEGVYRRAARQASFELFAPFSVTSFAEDSTGTIWATDSDTAFRPLDSPRRLESLSVYSPSGEGLRLLYDRSGNLWIGTRGTGLLRLRVPVLANVGPKGKQQDSVERLTSSNGLVSNIVDFLFEDRDGAIWVGSRGGLSRLWRSEVKTSYSNVEKDAFVNAVVRSRDGSIWIATTDGLRRITKTSEERIYGVRDGLPGQIVTALHEDLNGTFWVATTKGIARRVGERFDTVRIGDKFSPNNVRSMTSDSSGALWMSDWDDGLLQLKGETINRLNDLFGWRSVFAYRDSLDRIWIAFWRAGVARYASNETVPSLIDRSELAANVIFEDTRGTVWLGTRTGLAKFNKDRIIGFTEQGFPRSSVWSIVEDNLGHLWLGLDRGLLRISLDEFTKPADHRLQYTLYGPENGLRGVPERPGTPSSALGPDGSVRFVTTAGLMRVNPSNLQERPIRELPRIEDVIVDGRMFEPQSEIRFPPNPSTIQIDYSLLNLAGGSPHFRYRLDGFDSGWNDAGSRRSAFFTNLGPGAYRFRVAQGDLETEANLRFFIQPAFYQTTMFYFVVIMFVASATWATWRMRLRSAQRAWSLVLAERLRVSREMHDTLLQSLVAMALDLDDVFDQFGQASSESLKKQVSQLREQVEEYIREARDSIWNLRSASLDSNSLAHALERFGAHAALFQRAKFEFGVIGETRPLPPNVEQQLVRIGQEALRNAFHHASATVIRAELCYEADALHLKIVDNGRGFNHEHVDHDANAHYGIAMMRERAHGVGAVFKILSGPGLGTAVEIVAPY